MKNLLLLITLIVAGWSPAIGQETQSNEGSELPDLVVKNSEGENVNIQSLADGEHITIISFWATWCKPCIKELTNISDLLEDWESDYNVRLVAISVDDARNSSKVKPFAAGRGWSFDILLDPNGEVQRAMNVSNPPTTMIADPNGKIVYLHTGYQEGDEYEIEDHLVEMNK